MARRQASEAECKRYADAKTIKYIERHKLNMTEESDKQSASGYWNDRYISRKQGEE